MEKISVRKLEIKTTVTIWDSIWPFIPVLIPAAATIIGAIIGVVPTFAVLLINILLLRPRIKR